MTDIGSLPLEARLAEHELVAGPSGTVALMTRSPKRTKVYFAGLDEFRRVAESDDLSLGGGTGEGSSRPIHTARRDGYVTMVREGLIAELSRLFIGVRAPQVRGAFALLPYH